ncbi:MAG: 30S ribosomal protein S9 [Minisyncoccia bacterium]
MANRNIAEKYVEAVGRRKTAVARARLTPTDKTSVVINDRALEHYFPTEALRGDALAPFTKAASSAFAVTVRVSGGGIAGQADAVSHAIARALVAHDVSLRGDLKHDGLLKRDPRAKERRKFGLKKARKAPQWSKR